MLFEILGLVLLLVLSGGLAAALGRFERLALGAGLGVAAVACALGVPASLDALGRGEQGPLRLPWTMPIGEPLVGLDPLSAFFLLCIFLVSGLAAVYGIGYLRAHRGRRRPGPVVAWFNILVASMIGVVLARDAVLFLLAWEGMSISSLLLVAHENEREEVRRAAMSYLIASQLGVVFLFVHFAVLSGGTGRYDFAAFVLAGPRSPALAGACFILALAGFGTKAGFWPAHIWLPDAHPAAPSHVSALMSGVMIKMGIYGLVRTLGFLGAPPAWWGGVVLVIGVVSGIAGVLHALAQHDLKRLLAYHSVENIGIIALGIGVGLLGRSAGNPVVAYLGYAGALLHVLNHGLFKGLLFQAAGSVLHGSGTREIESLGGLARRMPLTGLAFLLGSAAICGLPPLNGFVSEWLIYGAAFRSGGLFPAVGAIAGVVTIASLALIGGLAAACFAKAYGVVFLGEPRTDLPGEAREAGGAMCSAMIAGMVLCGAIGVAPAGALRIVAPAVRLVAGAARAEGDAARDAAQLASALAGITRAAAFLIGLAALLALVRRIALRRSVVGSGVTWGCGYNRPTPRMQYTASSFAEPLLRPFARALHLRVRRDGPAGYFPRGARYEEHVEDRAGQQVIVPAIDRAVGALLRLRVLQHGRIQLYVVYILVALIALLAWQLAGAVGH